MALLVNGEQVPEEMLAAEVRALRTRFDQLSPDDRVRFGFDADSLDDRAQEWARENIIERVLLRQEAVKDPEPLPADVFAEAVQATIRRFGGPEKFAQSGLTDEDVRRETEVSLKVERLISRLTARVKPPKSKDVAARYRRDRERWKSEEQVRAAHVVKHVNEETPEEQARAAIETAQRELDEGADFSAVADRHSDCPGNGGDLGWFPRGKMVAEFERAVFEMEPGQVSGVFRTSFGFHIAKLLDRRPAAVRPLSEVRSEVEQELRRELENKAVEDFVDSLRARASVEAA